MAKELTWREAIEKVLSKASGAVHYRDITDKIIEERMRTNLGATPAFTVNAYLTTSIKNEGERSPFKKLGNGLYLWKETEQPRAERLTGTETSLVATAESGDQTELQYKIISSFGMFWRRDAIDWISTPKILGMQQIGASDVNFHGQVGIYLLYDGREVIYVGRTAERPLGRRLYEHTLDRFSARWDRFSWFGLRPVSSEGELGKMPEQFEGNLLIPALEAILIEALEPRQNRKRGDDLYEAEYIQKEDPAIQKKRAKQTFDELLNKS